MIPETFWLCLPPASLIDLGLLIRTLQILSVVPGMKHSVVQPRVHVSEIIFTVVVPSKKPVRTSYTMDYSSDLPVLLFELCKIPDIVFGVAS